MITVSVARGRCAPPTLSTLFLSVTTQPSSAPSNDVAFTTQPAIQTIPAAASVTVTVAINNGNGTFEDPVASGTLGGTLTAVTNGAGLATFTNLKLTGLIGARKLVFTAPTYTSALSALVTVVPGAATKAAITVNPAGATTAVAFTTQPIVQLQDVSSNYVVQASVNVVAAKASGSGTLSGTTTVATDAFGVAAFTNLVITGTGDHTLSFTPTSLTLATSNTFTVASASSTALEMVTQPSGSVATVAFTTQPAVRLMTTGTPYTYAAGVDENPLSDGSKWTTPTGSTALKTLTGTFRCSNEANICNMYVNSTGLATVNSNQKSKATFAAGTTAANMNLVVRDQGDGACYFFGGSSNDNIAILQRRTAAYQYIFLGSIAHTFAIGTDIIELEANGTTITGKINGITKVSVTDVNLTGGRPGLMLYGDAQADTYEGGSLSVPFLSSGVSVAAAKHAGVTGTLSGTTPVTTDANGIATFTNLAMSAAESGVTLDFTSAGLTTVVSSAFTVTSGAATKIVMVTQPSGAVDDVAFTTQPSVRLQDAASNNVLTASVTITVAKQTGTGTIGGTLTADTNASGIATFTNVKITGTGAHTLRFSSGGLTTIDSSSFTVQAAGAPDSNYPNLPAGLSTRMMLDFSQNIPAPNPNDANYGAISGGVGFPWYVQPQNKTKITNDTLEPISPNTAWEVNFPAGSYGGGVVGAGPGTGFGDFAASQEPFASWTSQIYVCASVWWDSNFEWHPVSNKFFEFGSYLSGGSFQLLIQSVEGGAVLRPHELYNGYSSTSASNVAITLGVWHKLEIYLQYNTGGTNTGTCKLWFDGVQRVNDTNINLPGSSGWQQMYFRNFRGGGGETKTRASQMRYGHFYVAGA